VQEFHINDGDSFVITTTNREEIKDDNSYGELLFIWCSPDSQYYGPHVFMYICYVDVWLCLKYFFLPNLEGKGPCRFWRNLACRNIVGASSVLQKIGSPCSIKLPKWLLQPKGFWSFDWKSGRYWIFICNVLDDMHTKQICVVCCQVVLKTMRHYTYWRAWTRNCRSRHRNEWHFFHITTPSWKVECTSTMLQRDRIHSVCSVLCLLMFCDWRINLFRLTAVTVFIVL